MEQALLTYEQIEKYIKSYDLKDPAVTSRGKDANVKLNYAKKFSTGLMIRLLDYTYLADEVSEEKIVKIVSNITSPESVAGLCVKPSTIPIARKALTKINSQVKLVSVAGGFPKNIDDITEMLHDVKISLQNKSDEIDLVLDTASFLDGNYRYCAEKIRKSSELCHSFNAKLKVILEISELENTDQVAKASMLCILSGADFIKTSTGYTSKGANYDSVDAMCRVISRWYADTGLKVGIKPSGGIDSLDKYNNYLLIIERILGDSWLRPDLTRIGASKIFIQLTSNKSNDLAIKESKINY